MEPDTFKTIESVSEGLYKEKGSKFLSFAIPVSKQEDIKDILDKIKKDHHVARHHCYAYMLGIGRDVWRVNDDGEPSGTAGRPILGQINSHELSNILIVVSRYFGGTLLGVSGLINAYRSAALSAITNAKIIDYTLNEYYELSFPYISMNDVMKVLKEENISQVNQEFYLDCRITISFRQLLHDHVLGRLSKIESIKVSYLETR